jgi:sulfate transport system ATP-binding protein
VRPEDLRVGEGGWEATVVASQRSGPRVRLRAQLHGVDEQVELELPVDAAAAHPPGSRVGLLPARYGAFPAA